MPRKKSDLGRRTKDAQRGRLRIQNETEEQRELRLSKDRDRHFLRRSRETSAEREQRLRSERERRQKTRQLAKRKSMKTPNLSPNKVNPDMNDEFSIEYNSEPVDSYANDTSLVECTYEPDDTNINETYSIESKYGPDDSLFGTLTVLCENCAALIWKGETKGLCCIQGELRLSKDRDRHFLRRSRETSAEREQRLRSDRERRKKTRQFAKRKSMKTPNLSQNKVNPNMNDEFSIEYNSEPVDSLFGTLTVLCEKCAALIWKGETKGLCCLPGKVKLEEISPPPEPLQSL